MTERTGTKATARRAAIGFLAVLTLTATTVLSIANSGVSQAGANTGLVCPTVDPSGAVSPAPSAGVNWSGCDLTDGGTVVADLAGANLIGANFSGANLTGADLANSDITGADFSNANLSNSDLSNAVVDQYPGGQPTGLGCPGPFGSGCTSDGVVCAVASTTVGLPENDPYPSEYSTTCPSGPDFTDAILTGANVSNLNLGGEYVNLGATTVICHPGSCFDISYDETFLPATLTGVVSGGLIGLPQSLPISWSVTDGYLGEPATFTSASSTTFGLGKIGSFEITTTGPIVPTLSAIGHLPSGVNLVDHGNGTATLSGTPSFGSAGDFSITIEANAGGAITDQPFDLVVSPLTPAVDWSNPPAIVTTQALSSSELDATASVPGSFAYNPPIGTRLEPGIQTLSVTFSPSDNVDYSVVTATTQLIVYSGLTCSKVSGNVLRFITFKSCTPYAKPDKSATAPGSLILSGGTIVWFKSGQTSVVSVTASSPGQGRCKKHAVEYDVSGSVVGGSSSYAPVNDPVRFQLCESKGGGVSLASGTSASL